MATAVHVALQLALGIALPAAVIRRDLSRLPAQARGRCWNEASLWSAVVAFGPIALLVHFARSRRSSLGFALGLAWALVHVALLSLLALLFESFGG